MFKPHGSRLFDEIAVEMLVADHFEDGGLEVGIRDDGASADESIIDANPLNAPIVNLDPIDIAFDSHIDAVL